MAGVGAMAGMGIQGIASATEDSPLGDRASAEASGRRLILSAPLTHSDWMLREGVAWGPQGVRHMLDACKACGWSRVYWRCLDGGRSLYRSTLMDAQGKWEDNNFWHPTTPEDEAFTQRYTQMTPDARAALLARIERYDYGAFDTLAEAVRYGHEIGLQIHAWLSINEDDHGWGIRSRFAIAHPESRWRKRDGEFYRSQQSFAFPAVMEYKLAIVREIVENYEVDGIFLDWIRTGDVRDNPQTDGEGVADHGYEDPLVAGFKAKHGVDPHDVPNGDERWVRFRAGPHTEFMRAVRKLVGSRKRDMPVSVMVAHPWCYRGMQDRIHGNLRGLLLDVKTWAREELMDAAVAAGYYLAGGDAEKAYNAVREETEGKVDVWLYAWVPSSVEEVEADVALARTLGARQILFWEADYIDGKPNRDELQAAMRRHAAEGM
ncbi:MAG: family 10 glycosylhydrolase [Armatimonadota bacterium]|nr:MAG: family 10 glycosylhydrolase [Armatimonadota bacterium]